MENDLFDLSGKVAVVTGGNGILGRSMCAGLAGKGAKVVILGRNKETGEAVAATTGGEACFYTCDVLDKNSLVTIREDVLKKFGKIDILVNAAGGNMAGACIQPNQSFFDIDVDSVRKVMDLNYFGTLIPILVFGVVFAKQKYGSIINITSATVERPLTRVMGYSSAKAAVKNLTQYLATEFATKVGPDVRVNALTPGFFLTEQNRTLLINPDGTLTPRGGQIIQNTPMKRMGKPEDLQGALIYLASDASRFVTGSVSVVDGGFDAYAGV